MEILKTNPQLKLLAPALFCFFVGQSAMDDSSPLRAAFGTKAATITGIALIAAAMVLLAVVLYKSGLKVLALVLSAIALFFFLFQFFV